MCRVPGERLGLKEGVKVISNSYGYLPLRAALIDHDVSDVAVSGGVSNNDAGSWRQYGAQIVLIQRIVGEITAAHSQNGRLLGVGVYLSHTGEVVGQDLHAHVEPLLKECLVHVCLHLEFVIGDRVLELLNLK